MRIFLENDRGLFISYLAIEPDPFYLAFLQDVAEQYETGKIDVKNSALSDKQEVLRMRNYVGENSVVCADGDFSVQAYSLDELMKDKKCTFLKIDVEGYEKKVIGGVKS